MVFIPPPHMLQQKGGTKQSPRELAASMFVVFVIMLGIALFVFIAGPRSNNPPPLIVGYVVSGLALLFGFIAFLAWMKAQGEPDNADRNNTDSES